MRPMLRRLRPGLRLRDEEGSMTLEACLVLPLWVGLYTMSYQFYDAFRAETQNTRAAYTIADMVSRQMDAIGPVYIDHLEDIFAYLTRAPEGAWIRVSSVYYDSSSEAYKVHWSYSTDTGRAQAFSNSGIDAQADQLPDLASGQTVILVETSRPYVPVLNVGLGQMNFTTFITTAPRFASKVPYDASS